MPDRGLIKKRWLIVTGSFLGLAGILLSSGFGVAYAYVFDLENSSGTIFSAWTSKLWRQTTVADFSAGVSENVSIVSAIPPPDDNGDVMLATSGSGGVLTNSPSTSSGYWNNPTGAYADGGGYAYITSGTPSASETYGGYGFSLAGSTITRVRVRYDAWLAGASAPASQTRRPTGDGAVAGTWITYPITGQPRYAQVDEEPPSDTDYIYCITATGGYSMYTFPAFTIPDGATITSVVLEYRARRAAGSGNTDAQASLMVGGTRYNSGRNNVTTTWTTYSYTWANNPRTGLPWTVDDVNGVGTNALQQFGNFTADSYPYLMISYCKLTVNYTTVEYNDQIRVDVSWDGGISWSSRAVQTLTGTETTYWYDVTGAPPGGWDATRLNDSNLRVRVDAYRQGAAAEEVRLDWLPVEVTYISAGYTSWGTIASQVLDTGVAGATWDLLSWDETLPAGTDITFEVRASDTPFAAGDPMPAWTSVGGTSPVLFGLPIGRYKQWRATLTTSNSNYTPILHEVRVWYDP